jgi:phosphoribosylaminoimidazole-succinocarboxamide synthase
LLVATDRISAFDVVLPSEIPNKGRVLTKLSVFWFKHLADICPNHLIGEDLEHIPLQLMHKKQYFRGRSMVVHKADVFPVECIVRGYLAGSGWKEYQKNGTVCGIELPPGLQESAELPQPIFTPTTKAEEGHDENITFEEMSELVGPDYAAHLRDKSLELYVAARDHAAMRGIIIADTKFEFGLADGEIMLVDEVLTPDSSRFWKADEYEPGKPQNPFDKQYVRDFLEASDWDKEPPGPELPEDVIEKTAERYAQAYEMITGQTFEPPVEPKPLEEQNGEAPATDDTAEDA